MKKFRWDKKYLYWGVTAFCVIAASLMFFWFITRWDAVLGILKELGHILSSVIIGLCITYLLAPALNFFEKALLLKLGRRLFPKNARKAASFSRVCGVVIVITLMYVIIIGLLVLALPQVYLSFKKLATNMPVYYNTAVAWLNDLFSRNVETESTLAGLIRGATDYFTNWVQTRLLPSMENILASISTGVIGVVMAIFKFVVGTMVSVYVLFRKEQFAARAKKVLYSLFSRNTSARIIEGTLQIHKKFGSYIVGKLIDSMLVGSICLIFMLIAGMPYPELISVLVGMTNIIPFFGPYIGAIPSAFLILLENPVQCLIFVIFIFILQTVDGNVIDPHISGSKTGISGFWVIFSIMFFGGLFGVPGMLLGVPLFAVIYDSFGAWCMRRLKKKKLPTETEAYYVPGTVEPRIPPDETGQPDLPPPSDGSSSKK